MTSLNITSQSQSGGRKARGCHTRSYDKVVNRQRTDRKALYIHCFHANGALVCFLSRVAWIEKPQTEAVIQDVSDTLGEWCSFRMWWNQNNP
ncbi:MAG: hypothetical protein R3E90_10065 [Marinicella sp.]